MGVHKTSLYRFIAIVVAVCLLFIPSVSTRTVAQSQQLIVRGASSEQAAQAVQNYGGHVIKSLDIIDAVVATVPAGAIPSLEQAGLFVMLDAPITTADDRVETPGQLQVNAQLQANSAEKSPPTQAEAVQPESGLRIIDIPDSETSPPPPGGCDGEEDKMATDGCIGGAQPTSMLFPSQTVGADLLHAQGIDGENVTVAMIDSGMPPLDKPDHWHQVDDRTLFYNDHEWFIVFHDLVTNSRITNSSDSYGHGTHVLSTIADNRKTGTTKEARTGIAPKANLVVIRALDSKGMAPYSRVIEGIQWIIEHNAILNVKVLNLSLQATVASPYWYDALNQAVMAAWDAGITVVVAAGNSGPEPVTVMAPGNIPYVITVGAIKPGVYTDNGVDQLAVYSSTGPTESKFIKPDLLAPGSRVLAPFPANSALAGQAGLVDLKAKLELPKFKTSADLNYYYLSGTSMAAAEVSGIVALMLEQTPTLTNDQIKYRLLSTAQLAVDDQDQAVYSIWQQGAGKVDLAATLASTSSDSANAGLDLTLDRDPESGTHYMGATEFDEATGIFSFPTTVGGSSYSSWAGSYSSWAGSYSSWAGSYSSWAGSYSSWAGSYSSWAGSYSSWAGSYSSWAGSYHSWAGSYSSWAGSVILER